MPEPSQDRMLVNAGGLLLAAGCIAAFTGGMYGLTAQNPWLVILSVGLLMGYGVVGYLLMNRGRAYFGFAMPASAVLVALTILLFQSGISTLLDENSTRFILEPMLALLLAFAGGALVFHAIEQTTMPVRWPGRGAPSLNSMLHIAAAGPIWGAFTLLTILGNKGPAFRIFLIGGAVLVAILLVVGAYAATRHGHPRITMAAAALGFVGCSALLFQFMLGVNRDSTLFGELVALVGLILTGLTGAIATVAWIQIASGVPAEDPAPLAQPQMP